ncbi:hypothetical protein KSP39_PZI013327 [Platanthera zijinensis]|uniref:Uncharacterized protein n=1 Tax=Platanthera zijinensis TaxID=2320716 RepID=A0AAP0BDW0_9ASPA
MSMDTSYVIKFLFLSRLASNNSREQTIPHAPLRSVGAQRKPKGRWRGKRLAASWPLARKQTMQRLPPVGGSWVRQRSVCSVMSGKTGANATGGGKTNALRHAV